MTWIKICGITNLEDAQTAINAGADALGFVFYDKSPRRVDVGVAQSIVRELPNQIEKVGVFVDADADTIRQTASQVGLTAIQLHGQDSMEDVWQDSRPVRERLGVSRLILAVPGDRLKQGGVLITDRAREEVFALLLDAQTDGKFGGTGATFDWRGTRGMVQIISFKIPVIVAGGLTASNAAEAVRILKPFGVDVSSGVEASPGKKDPEKIRTFIQAARSADKRTS
jgi:phosphoribosylanthranilate isomerase